MLVGTIGLGVGKTPGHKEDTPVRAYQRRRPAEIPWIEKTWTIQFGYPSGTDFMVCVAER